MRLIVRVGNMNFPKRVSLSVLAISTFLTPIHIVQAQEKACVAVTEVSGDGQIIWSKSPDIAELVEGAQKLEISPADYKKLCGGEEVVEEASDEKPEDEKEKTEEVEVEEATADEKVDPEKTASSAKSAGFGWGGAALGGLVAAAVGGSGGSSSSSSSTYNSTTEGAYGTEYNAQAGLAFVNALGLNDYGYTGDGVKVGVVDTGIDKTHAEFDGKTIYGQDFASSATGYGFDEQGHGSHVASIIAGERDASGMRGVAYDATLYDYKQDNDGDSGFEGLSSDSAIASVYNQHVTDGINVSNNSWGSGSSNNATTYSEATLRASFPNTITALRAAQSSGTLIVFAAGNETLSEVDYYGGLPYRITELADEWLVVGAVNTSGVEASFNNRCGVAKAFCVVAPGVSIYASQTNGSYTTMSGTSMAAPHVAGVAAALMEKFPSLTTAQIATRILSTASYANLTGRGGETAANSTAAEMEAIFGQGLVNSTAAAAVIGNYIYANGSNLNNGQNLSVSKLSLPAGLPVSTQYQVLGSKFIVFDSFDGARFSVGGDEVFEASHSSIARTYGTTKTIDTHSNTDLSFTSTGQKIVPSKWAPRYIMSGNSNEMAAAEGFWGKTASMLSSQPFVKGQPSTNFIWAHSYGDFAIQPFIQTQDEMASSQSIGSYGASFHLNFSNGLKAVTGYKISNHLFDNGILSDSASAGSAKDFEVGFKQEISPSENLFLRFSNTQIDDIAASDKTFGFKNVTANSWTFGYETQSNIGNFTFGVSSPSQLSNGTVSLMTPSGRTKSGDVLYTETEFAISRDNKMERFIAYQFEQDELSISFGVVEDKYNYGKIGAAKLDISMPF
jgi:subtilisin family serine protease